MPVTTHLQIQGAEDDATRVVALNGTSLRIGRGAICEVRLPESALAEVQCLIRLRGTTWQVQPIGPSALMSLGGEPLNGLRSLPIGVPLRIGTYRLTLHEDAGDAFANPIDVAPHAEPPPREAGADPRSEAEAERISRWQARVEQRERWLQSRGDEKSWEARWRAAGEGLKARNASTASRPEPAKSPPRRVEVSRDPAAGQTAERPRPRSDSATHQPQRPAVRPMAAEPPQSRGLVTLPPTVPPVQEEASEPAPEIPSIPRQVPTPEEPPELEPPAAAVVEPIASEPPAGVVEEVAPPSPIFDPPPPASAGFWHQEALADLAVEAKETQRPIATPRPVGAWPGTTPNPPDAARPAPERSEFPRAATILAAQGTRPVAAPAKPAARTVRASRRPLPTEAIEPAAWALPIWAAGPPVALGSLILIATGLVLGFAWTKDNGAAGLAARASHRSKATKAVALDPAERPETRWWKTTAGHMALWAAAIELSPEGASRADEVIETLDAAHRAAPLQAEVRFALARPVAGSEPPPGAWSAGLSRDIASLTLTGRALKRAGKAEAALRPPRRGGPRAPAPSTASLDPPTFDDDPKVRRFRLPHEGIVAWVVRDMIEAGDWGFADWSRALPTRALVRLAAGRLLRERSNTDAGRAFEMALEVKVLPPPGSPEEAEHYAAEAEALALLERKAEAADRYRRAIGLAGDETTRRRWRLGLAEILGSLEPSPERGELLEAAKVADPSDDVTRKALEAQRYAGLR